MDLTMCLMPECGKGNDGNTGGFCESCWADIEAGQDAAEKRYAMPTTEEIHAARDAAREDEAYLDL